MAQKKEYLSCNFTSIKLTGQGGTLRKPGKIIIHIAGNSYLQRKNQVNIKKWPFRTGKAIVNLKHIRTFNQL